MRIKLNLSAGNDISIPIEYGYHLYLSLRKSVFGYLESHKPKLLAKYKRNFPAFTFSQLMIPERDIMDGFIKILGNYLSLFISSADDQLVEYMARSITEAGEFVIYGTRFKLKKVDVIEEPEFGPEMKFKMLSPLLLVAVIEGKSHFVKPGDSDLSDIFADHLVKEYNKMYEGSYLPSQIRLIPDQGYMERKKVVTRMLTIRNINYRTIFCPITLKGEPELIRFAYRNGIGEKTSFGMGMIEVLK